MGQQQLLFVVLGVIIIGISVVVAIVLFNQKSIEVKKDNITDELTNLANMAQQFHHKPAMIGGGGGSFTGWDIPGGLKTTANAIYTVEDIQSNTLKIKGVSTELVTGSEHLVLVIDITPSNFTISPDEE